MTLEELLASDRPGRVALLGVGNELNGDDAVGIHVVRGLGAQLGRREDLLFIEAGTAPENFTGPLRRFRPDLILLIDAASFDQPAGSTTMINWPETDGFSGSTHTLPPSVFAKYLVDEIGCRLALVGIQPGRLEFGQALSPEVMAASGRLVNVLAGWLAADPQRGPA